MRNKEGIFIGDTTCEYNRGVDRMEERICCGGRKNLVAYIQCSVKGVVRADIDCNLRCRDKKMKGN